MRPGVYVTESVLATPTQTFSPTAAAGAMVAPLPSGPNIPTLITSWYQFSRIFGPLNNSYEATFAANLFFRTGGRELYVVRATRPSAVIAEAEILSSTDEVWGTFSAKSPGAYGNNLRVRVRKNAADLYDIFVLQEAGESGVTADDTVLESYMNLDFGTFGSSEITSTINIRSQWVNFTWATSEEELSLPTTISVVPLTGGTDGTPTEAFNYTAALTALGQIDRTFVLFSPGETASGVVSAMVAFAEDNKGFYVVDTPADETPADAVDFAGGVGTTTHAAVYYPYLWIADQTSRSRSALRKVAPSGAVAGMILNTDATAGVFKPPAGVTATLPGVVALERTLAPADLDLLNNDTTPVNAIRIVAGVGPVVMGARTLNQARSTRYVNIRRSMLFLDRELRSMLEFALFKNAGPALWSEMNTVVNSYLESFWSLGGLRGNEREQAFYVKIDNENNTLEDIMSGVVNVEIGVALQYPAEFIKIQLTQTTAA